MNRSILLLAFGLAVAAAALAQEVSIKNVAVRGGVYLLEGQGGNIGLLVGEDGAYLIDDQYAPLTEKILAAVAAVTDRPVRFLVNTHWHGDHTGGNENLGERGAIICAHDNVRRRLSTDQFMETFGRTVAALPKAGLPVITFSDSVTFHWNGEEIHVFHVKNAHTDGDSIIHFRKANVFHMGDTFFNGMYPFIDPASGGVIDGVIAAVDQVLALADDDTLFIPGHGKLGTKAELLAYREMLATVRDRIAALLAEGRTKHEILAAGPAHEFDEQWGQGFMKPALWVGIVVDGMRRNGEYGK